MTRHNQKMRGNLSLSGEQPPTRPFLRYHGGKWLLAPWLLTHMPDHKVYVEPFGGAASVLLQKTRSHAEVYNDCDGEIVNLFRVARDQGDTLARAVALTPFAREEFALSYEPAAEAVEQARRTVIRSFMGFGSNALRRITGFRADGHRVGTTPASDWRNYPDMLNAIIERLQGVIIEHRDAGGVMRYHDASTTLHYVDPPYNHGRRGDNRGYTHEMSDHDHERLAALLHDLSGMVMVSGYRGALYDRLFADWYCVRKATYADGARPRTEALWLNPLARAHVQQPDLFTQEQDNT